MAGDSIDEAYVEIKPDVSGFDRELQRDLNRSFERIEDKVDDLTDTISKQFDRLVAVLDANFSELVVVARDTFDEIKDQARDAGRTIATDIEAGTKIAKHEIDDLADDAKHDFNRIDRAARGSGFSIGRMFSGLISSVGKLFTGLFSNVSEQGSKAGSVFGSTIGQVGSSIGTITGSIGGVAQIALWAVLIPVVIELAGALIQLSGALFALPAAAGVAVAAIAPLIISFQGIGEAVSAGLSGDTEKFNEALKGLAPSAQKVVKEIVSLNPQLTKLKRTVQENFFAPLVGAITPLARVLLPVLTTGLSQVAGALGRGAAGFAQLLGAQDILEDINNIFASTVRIIDRLAPSINDLLGVLFGVAEKGLPFVERLFGVFADGIDKVTAWLSKIQQNGQLQKWLEKAWSIGKDLFEVLKQLGIFFGTVFGSFADEGQDTLKGMADSIAKLNAYLQTKDGQEALHNLGVLFHWAANALVALIANGSKAYNALNKFFAFIRGIGPFFVSVGNTIKDTWNSIVDWVIGAWDSITSGVSSGWNGVLSFLSSTWESIKTFFVDGWNSIVNGVTTAITNVKNALIAFPGLLVTYIQNAVHATAYTVGYVVASIVEFFATLPQRVGDGLSQLWTFLVTVWNSVISFFTTTIPALGANIAAWFQDMWHKASEAVQNAITSIVTFASSLPDRVGSWVSAMRERVVGLFTDVKTFAINKFKELVNGAVAEAKALPGRAKDALNGIIGVAKDIGHDMIMGMVNGIKAAAGALWNAARQVVEDALQGAKDKLLSRSPSKRWAELGKDSVLGYNEGFDGDLMTRHAERNIQMPLDAFNSRNAQVPTVQNSVSVGGAQIVAYLQINDDQLHPVVVRTMRNNPQEVALAAQNGDTKLSRRR